MALGALSPLGGCANACWSLWCMAGRCGGHWVQIEWTRQNITTPVAPSVKRMKDASGLPEADMVRTAEIPPPKNTLFFWGGFGPG